MRRGGGRTCGKGRSLEGKRGGLDQKWANSYRGAKILLQRRTASAPETAVGFWIPTRAGGGSQQSPDLGLRLPARIRLVRLGRRQRMPGRWCIISIVCSGRRS